MKNYLICCVNYNSYSSLVQYLNSIEEADRSNVNVECYICDNSNPKCEINSNNYSYNIFILKSKKNLGYFDGINYILDFIGKEHLEKYDYCIISNVDIKYDETFFYEFGRLQINSSIGCLSPKIIDVNSGYNRNPKIKYRYNKLSVIILALLYILHLFKFYKAVRNFYNLAIFKSKSNSSDGKIIYGTHGACFIFILENFDVKKLFPYEPFLFGEEIHVAEVLKNNNLNTVYCDNLIIFDGMSVSTSLLKRFKLDYYNFESLKFILKKYY